MSDNAVMDSVDLEIEANQHRSRELLKQLHDLNKETAQKKSIKKSKESLEKNRGHENDRLTHKPRRPNTIIKQEVRELIRENVVGNGMSVSNAMKTFKVSRRQIQCIKVEDPNAVKVNKKRPGKFTNEMTMAVLMQLDEKYTTTLAEMAK